jgi:hypothetical protein
VVVNLRPSGADGFAAEVHLGGSFWPKWAAAWELASLPRPEDSLIGIKPEDECMDRESVERLRFDRRLQRRRGWVEQSDYEAHLDSLADTSDKMIRGIGESDESETTAAAAPERAAAPVLADVSATSPAGDPPPSGSFSGGGSGLP